jgi:hypothetical protein
MTTNPLEILFHIIWIITEADRSATTILLPSDYEHKTCSASVTSTRAALLPERLSSWAIYS